MKIDEVKTAFRFYQKIEKELIQSREIAELSKRCRQTYSIVYASMLLDICSNFESLLKLYFDVKHDEEVDMPDLIVKIKRDNELSKILDEIVITSTEYGNIRAFDLTILKKKTDDEEDRYQFKWWDNYNKLKHNKFKNLEMARQDIVLKSLCALYALNNYILKIKADEINEVDVFESDVNFFKLKNLKPDYLLTNNSSIRLFKGECSGSNI